MTRPMPGPPEDCYCRDGNATCDDCETYGYRYSWGLCPGCELHNGRDLGAYKRLKDAECAAEYWRALRDDEWEDYDMLDGYGPPNIDPWGKEWWPRSGIANEDRLNTWRRFARTPHALEEA